MAVSTSDATKETFADPEMAKGESSVLEATKQDSSISETAESTSDSTKEPEKTKKEPVKFVDPFWFLSNKEKHQASCASMFIGFTAYFVWDVVVMMPCYYKEFNGSALRHLLLQSFFYLNIFGNILYAMFVGNSKHEKVRGASADAKPGWRYCDECKLYLPPRSHHCKVCNVCVLKRDHHCVFTGNCISFKTRRYFLMILLHCWMGGIYNLIYQFDFVWIHTGGNMLTFALSLSHPRLVLARAETELLGFFVSILELIGLIITGVVSVLLGMQIRAVLRGQTMYELNHGITTYDCGYVHNIRNNLGTRWYLVWLSPTVRSPLPGDHENHKIS